MALNGASPYSRTLDGQAQDDASTLKYGGGA
jgi:hypothetical protein